MYISHFSGPLTPPLLGSHPSSCQRRWPDPIELENLAPDCSQKELFDLLAGFDPIRRLIILQRKRGAGHSVSAFVFCSTASGRDNLLEAKRFLVRGCFVEVRHLDQQDYASLKRVETAQRKVFIRGLQHETNEVTLRNYFSRFGEVEGVEIPRNHIDRASRRIAFVTFCSVEDALNCLCCRIHKLRGKPITCRPYQDKLIELESSNSALQSLRVTSIARTGAGSGPRSDTPTEATSNISITMHPANQKTHRGTRADSAGSVQKFFPFGRRSMAGIISASQIGSDCTDCPSEPVFQQPGAGSAKTAETAPDSQLFNLGPEESDVCVPNSQPICTRKVHVSYFTVPGYF